MTLRPGTRLGSYQVLSALGAGGMGEVYRARDTKLQREVALKVLPDRLAGDPERLARFRREAQVLASLNHPNIGAIYGLEESSVGQQDVVRALVLELIEGSTLADRIARGPMACDEALPIARQIVDALEAAHDQGIVHRDLKPANIKVREDGTVKVLDFGLAKAFEPMSRIGAGGDASPTITAPAQMTEAGVILGTAAYMAPEQAKGLSVDKCADVWAFGCVLWEMLSGARVFPGDTVPETLAAVLRNEPDWQALPDDTPPAVRRLLRRALIKSRRERLADMSAVRLEIDDAMRGVSDGEPAQASGPPTVRPRRRWLTLTSVVALVALAAMGGYALRPAPSETRTLRFVVRPPANTQFNVSGPMYIGQALSPDGRFLVMSAQPASGPASLWLQSFDAIAPRQLAGTDGAAFPFWSPDSASLAFFARGKLMRLDVAAGAPQVLCDLGSRVGGNFAVGGTWNRDGVVLFASMDGLYRVSASGGTPELLTRTDASRQEAGHGFPQFLPDGQRFLFFVSSAKPEVQGMYVGSLDQPLEPRKVLSTDTKAEYAPAVSGRPAYLLFMRGETLVAQVFGADTVRLEGEVVLVAENVAVSGARANFWVSDAGVLAYSRGAPDTSRLKWISRSTGQIDDAAPEDRYYATFRLSPDRRRLAFARLDNTGTPHIWQFGFEQPVPTRLTFMPKADFYPLWSPDGREIAFMSDRTGTTQLYRKSADGRGGDEQLTDGPNAKIPTDWSRDGYLIYSEFTSKTSYDILAVPLARDRKPIVIAAAPYNEFNGRVSPDGNWLAYQSNESGRAEIYIRPVPWGTFESAAAWPVSNGGGTFPAWRGDGVELFYVAPSGTMMAVTVRRDPDGIKTDSPRSLFSYQAQSYDVSADGQRFLLSEPSTAAPGPLTVVVNWQSALRK